MSLISDFMCILVMDFKFSLKTLPLTWIIFLYLNLIGINYTKAAAYNQGKRHTGTPTPRGDTSIPPFVNIKQPRPACGDVHSGRELCCCISEQ